MRRRLATILVADVVGYSRLIEQDETGTSGALGAYRKEPVQPTVAQYRGRIFKVMGNGVLVEFASAVHAVECAVALRKGMGEFPRCRRGQRGAGPRLLRGKRPAAGRSGDVV